MVDLWVFLEYREQSYQGGDERLLVVLREPWLEE